MQHHSAHLQPQLFFFAPHSSLFNNSKHFSPPLCLFLSFVIAFYKLQILQRWKEECVYLKLPEVFQSWCCHHRQHCMQGSTCVYVPHANDPAAWKRFRETGKTHLYSRCQHNHLTLEYSLTWYLVLNGSRSCSVHQNNEHQIALVVNHEAIVLSSSLCGNK